MNISESTLEKMAAASNPKLKWRLRQFSLAALFGLFTASCFAALAARPVWRLLQHWFFESDAIGCGPCGMG